MEGSFVPDSEPASSFITARAIQQDYLEAFGCTDWNKFDQSNIFLIKQKIAFSMFGSPGSESGDLSEATPQSTYGYTAEQLERVLPIYEKICQFQKYSADHKSIFMSIIFVCCVPENKDVTDKFAYDQVLSDKIYISPVFRIRKCIKVNISDSRTGCCIFIDDIGRVYKNWSLYLENNRLPKGYIVAPANGRYHGLICDEEEGLLHVFLDVALSPASSAIRRLRQVGDYACTGVAVGAVGVLTVSIFAPITAGVALTTGVATGVTGLYGLLTSSIHLADRSKHDQSISLADPEARSCWLNLGASATGMIAGASSRVLAMAASDGAAIATGFCVAHDTAIVMAAVTSGAGLANNITNCVIKYNKTKEGPTSLEIFQIASSIFFLTNSIVSNKMANTIIEETHNTQTSYVDLLRSNRLRKVYDKVVADTRRISDQIMGNTEVVEGILNIENKDQFFLNAMQLNKHLLKRSVNFSNDERIISPREFYNLSSQDRATYLSSIGPANLSTSNVPTDLTTDISIPSTSNQIPVLSRMITIRTLIADFPNLSTATNDDFLKYIALKICEFAKNINIYNKFAKILKVIDRNLNSYMLEQLNALGIYRNDIFYQLFVFVYDYLKNICVDNMISPVIESLFINGELKSSAVEDLLRFFKNKLSFDYHNVVHGNERRCNICGGLTFSED